LAFIAALTGYIKNGIIYIANLVFFLFRSLSNKDLWRSLPGNLKNLAVTMPRQAFAYLYNLNWKKQALITVAVVAIVILTVNMVITSRRQKTAESIKEYENAASLIEQKQNQVEATLLYSNEEGAKKLFDEIGALINTLPQETDEQKTKYEKFKQTLDEQLAKMRRVTIVSDPAEIANFTNLSSQAQTENIFYAEVNKKIYAGDTSQRSIYIADTGNKLVNSLTDLAQPINTLLYPMINKNNILLFINRNAAIALDTKDDKLNNITAKWPAEIAAADIYNNNLYLVDKKNNDILKSESFATSFSTPVKWLKENADLANVVDISIDGSIYLLRDNGELTRYLKGKQDEFKLSLVDPALTSANKLYVSPEGKHIYILDNTGRRLLVFEKTGDYVMQYQSDKFTGLTDFSVDEKNKTIYVLCDNKVYRFEAENLK
jgi:sugar-specific transcriptional regulator TrmB